MIQEVINRSGWDSGNSLSVIITGTGQRTAESYDGSSSKAPLLIITYSVETTAPASIVDLAASAGNQEVALSWTAPYNGGLPITDYVVEYRLTPSGGWSTFNDGTSTNTFATVTGLTNDSEYEFRVSAKNSLGVGNSSNAATATPSTSTTLTIQISQSSDDAEQGPPDYDEDEVSVTSSDLDLDDETFVGLRFNGINIPAGSTISNAYVEFTSENDESGSSSVTISGQDIDDAPTFTTNDNNISSRIPTDANIVWNIPDWSIDEIGSDTQTPDLKTILQEVIDRAGWNSGNSLVLIFEEGDMNNDRDAYSFDQSQNKSPKLYITFSSEQGVPSAPINLVATSDEDEQVSLSWATPSSNGGESIDDYLIEVDYNDGAGFVPYDDNDSGTGTTTTVLGLINGIEHTFRVFAVNNEGTSPASNEDTATPADVPGQPEITSAVGGNQQVLLSWTIPAPNGADIVDYVIFVDYVDDNEGFILYPEIGQSTDNTNVPVSGLINGDSHSFKVKAVNSAGEGIFSLPVSATPTSIANAPFLHTADPHPDGAQVFVSWDAPEDDGGSDVEEYKIQYSSNGVFDDNTPSKTITGSPPSTEITVNGLTNGETYTFRVIAFNANGAGTPSNEKEVIPSTVPNPPLIDDLLTVTDDESVTFTWSSQGNGGFIINDYKVEYLLENTSVWVEVNDPPNNLSTTITLQDLLNGKEYAFRVSASNLVNGYGDPSIEIHATPGAAPDQIIDLSVVRGNTQVLLTWTAPDNNGFPLNDYFIEIDDGTVAPPDNWKLYIDNDDLITVNVPVNNLNNGDSYSFRVYANNDIGNGTPSLPVSAIPATVPGSPTIDTLLPDDSEIQVNWTAPVDNGGDSVKSYRLEWSQNNFGTSPLGSQIISDDPLSTTYTVKQLVNGELYYFRVFAINDVNESDDPSPVKSAIPVTTPDQPVLDVLPTVSDSTVHLTWPTPGTGGSILFDYTLKITNLTTNTDLTDVSIPSTALGYSASGLSNGDQYSFVLIAFNAQGQSDPSEPVTAIPLGGPLAVTGFAATVADESTVLTWNASDENGSGAISFYTITYSPDNGSPASEITVPASTNPLSTSISGLTNGELYTFTITATNGVPLPSEGADTTVTPLGGPLAVTGFAATVADESTVLTWNASDEDGSGPIVSYEITYSPNDGSPASGITVLASEARNVPISGLTNGELYTFTITATNGIPIPSEGADTTVTPLGGPGAIVFSDAEIDDGQITLNWSIPDDNNSGAIKQYTITYTPNDNNVPDIVITGDPPATSKLIASLDNGTPYTFTIFATNENNISGASSSQTVTPADEPVAPTISAVTRDDKKVKVDWSPSSDDGGDLLTLFTVEWSLDNFVTKGSGTVSVIPAETSPTTTYTLTAGELPGEELLNGKLYQFRVFAHNTIGKSLESVYESATPATFPDAPTLDQPKRGNASVLLTWSPNATGGDDIKSYRIEHATSADFVTNLVSINHADPDDTLNVSVSGLNNGQIYYFRVYATNDVDESASSNELFQTPATEPGKPLIGIPLPDDNKVTVSWTPALYADGEIDDGGSDILFYELNYRTSGSGWTKIDTADESVLSVVVEPLANGTPVFFEVFARNSVGLSDASDEVTATPATTPTIPLALSATPQTDKVLLIWSVPQENGGATITSYSVKWSLGTTFDPNAIVLPVVTISGDELNPPVTTATIPLTNGQAYSFVITASNSAGESDPSVSATATPANPPDAPILDIATSDDDTSSTLSWSPALDTNDEIIDGGSPITKYTITWTPEDGENQPLIISGDPLVTTKEISGLINGKEYSFSLTASNIVATSGSSDALLAYPSTNPSQPLNLLVTDYGN